MIKKMIFAEALSKVVLDPNGFDMVIMNTIEDIIAVYLDDQDILHTATDTSSYYTSTSIPISELQTDGWFIVHAPHIRHGSANTTPYPGIESILMSLIEQTKAVGGDGQSLIKQGINACYGELLEQLKLEKMKHKRMENPQKKTKTTLPVGKSRIDRRCKIVQHPILTEFAEFIIEKQCDNIDTIAAIDEVDLKVYKSTFQRKTKVLLRKQNTDLTKLLVWLEQFTDFQDLPLESAMPTFPESVIPSKETINANPFSSTYVVSFLHSHVAALLSFIVNGNVLNKSRKQLYADWLEVFLYMFRDGDMEDWQLVQYTKFHNLQFYKVYERLVGAK